MDKIKYFFFFIVNWGNKGVAKVLRKKECHGLSDIVKTIRMGSGNEKKNYALRMHTKVPLHLNIFHINYFRGDEHTEWNCLKER